MTHGEPTPWRSVRSPRLCQWILHLAAGCALASACVLPGTLSAQVIVDLTTFTPCQPCELNPFPIDTIGESAGPGTIDSRSPRVHAKVGRGYVVVDHPTRLKVFDAEGGFVRAFGRAGDGPGELRNIFAGAAFADHGRIVVLDGSKWSWLAYSEDGEFRSEAKQDLGAGEFLLLEGDTLAVVAAMDRRPNVVGYPLHLVDIRNGSILRHFGSTDRAWNMAEPLSRRVLLGVDDEPDDSVWWGKAGSVHLEQWVVDGSHLRTVRGDLPWFPPISDDRSPGTPVTAMTTFAVDGAEQLWTVLITPDEGWQHVRRSGPEGAIAGQADMMYDSRLDVFDLRSRRHIGSVVWDAGEIRLVKRGDSMLVSVVEYLDSLEPRVVLYEVELSESTRR